MFLILGNGIIELKYSMPYFTEDKHIKNNNVIIAIMFLHNRTIIFYTVYPLFAHTIPQHNFQYQQSSVESAAYTLVALDQDCYH